MKPTIDYVAKLQFPSGNLPSSLSNESDRLIHWCHGAPGAVFLFAKAYQVNFILVLCPVIIPINC